MASFQAGEGSNKRVIAPVGALAVTLAAAGGATDKWRWRFTDGIDTNDDGLYDVALVTDPMQACLIMVPTSAVGNVAVSFSQGGYAAGNYVAAEPGIPLPLWGQLTELCLENLSAAIVVVGVLPTWMRTTDAGGMPSFPLLNAANGFNWV